MKRAFTVTQFLIIIGVLLILAAILFPIFARSRENTRDYCQSNLKNVGLAFRQYVQDFDEKFPVIITGGSVFGWADALQPYIKSTQFFQCPRELNEPEDNPSPRAIGYTDYWMNSRLAGRQQSLLKTSALTILNGDGADGTDATDARYALDSIPKAWKGNKSSPLYRRGEGANFSFADGHVKWFQADRIAATDLEASPKLGHVTFALR